MMWLTYDHIYVVVDDSHVTECRGIEIASLQISQNHNLTRGHKSAGAIRICLSILGMIAVAPARPYLI